MKISLLLLLLISSFSSMGQSQIQYEQIAFNFYKDSILNEYPSKKKITLWQELEKEQVFLWGTYCLEEFGFRLNSTDTLTLNTSKRTRIELEPDKRFKIKKKNAGNYPLVYSTVSFSKKKDQNIVTIVEMNRNSGTTYHIVMNDEGQVKNWCKGGYVN